MGTTTKTGSSFETLILVYSIQEMGTIWVSIIKISYTFSPKSKNVIKENAGLPKIGHTFRKWFQTNQI